MFNKLYENKKKNNKEKPSKLMTFISIINVILISLILISLFIELPYGVYMPGGATSVINQLSNVKNKPSGDIATTHVSYVGGEILTIIGSFFVPNWDIIKVDDIKYSNEDIKEANQRRKIEMISSADAATIVAYKKAGKELIINSEDYVVSYILPEAITNLIIGYKILKYETYDYVGEEMSNYINTLNVGDDIRLTVKRDGRNVITKSKVVEIEGNKYIGIQVTTLNHFDKSTVTFNPNENESGASGGLMMSLGIYNSITNEDITKGRKICGTGTIDLEGNVGEISGVKYKVIGAKKDKCDIFLVPKENYEEAKNTINKFNYDIELKQVTTFDEALNYLKK